MSNAFEGMRKAVSDAIDRHSKAATDAVKKKMPSKLRGYQLYVQEAEVSGEKPVPYEKWIAEQ
jgi:hypothetical protein